MTHIKGVFIRYKSDGSPFTVEPDIRQKVGKIIALLKKNPDHQVVFNKEIKTFVGDGSMHVASELTWYQLVREIFSEYERDADSISEDTKNSIIALLKILCESTQGVDWNKVRNYILGNKEALSPTRPGRFSHIFGNEIQRKKDGTYFYKENNQVVIINGLKTTEEEAIGFYADDAVNPHGRLHALLKVVALFEIASEIQNNPQDFPERLRCQLFDNGFSDTGYLHWKWAMPMPFDYISFRWYPKSPYSNPDWLASDLIINIPEIHDVSKEQINMKPSDSEYNTWKDAFEDYGCQLEIPVRSNVLIGAGKEVYFDFMGRKLRWINGNAFMNPIIVVPSNDEECKEEIKLARRFMSLLNAEVDAPLIEVLISIQRPRYVPTYRDQRMPHFKGTPKQYALPLDNIEEYSEKKWAALAFNREASSSSSIMYRFLNYYKIIELGNDVNQTKNWIRKNIEDTYSGSHSEWLATKIRQGVDVAEYIYKTGRSAIAHARYNPDNRTKKIHNPDDPDDYKTTQELLYVVEELAKKKLKEIN